MSKKKLIEFMPIGGVGQIGSNVTQVLTAETSILVDFGILFPYENFFGIDYLVPDINTIKEPTDIVFTHAHEDHIGAVVHLLKHFPKIEIWASPFAARLIQEKLTYVGIKKEINFYSENSVLEFGDVKIQPIHVNHSIPETFGLFFEHTSNSFCAFFASDFKIDFNSPYEAPFNFEKLIKLSSKYKKRFAFIDSTNIASRTVNTPSEGDLVASFKKVFSENYSQYYVTLFSSNIHRMRTILEAAKENSLQVFASGRSMKKYIRIAQETGHLMSDIEIIDDAKKLERANKTVVLVSGCQGDYKSAFRRIGTGEDKHFHPSEDDVFIYSSKSIPGNEKVISLILNHIYDQGTRVITEAEMPVHVSGHPGKEDLRIFYEKYQPTDVIPIHGETSFLHLHKKFIEENFTSTKVHLLKNFTSLNINQDLSVELKEFIPNKPIIIHGKHLELPRTNVSERRKLASLGCIFVSISQKTSNIEITYSGLPLEIIEPGIDDLKRHLLSIVNQHNKKPSLIEDARVQTRNFFKAELGYKPLALIHLV